MQVAGRRRQTLADRTSRAALIPPSDRGAAGLPKCSQRLRGLAQRLARVGAPQ